MSGTVVDTSAVLSILFREAADADVLDLLQAHSPRLMSAATRVELGIVAEARLGPAGAEIVSRFIADAGIDLVEVDGETAERAVRAWRRFGRGRHPAALNFGACFSYATAEQHGLPLLCIGSDFPATDLEVLTPL